MRLRSFTAPDIHRAMIMIRETMGEDAVIISTTRDTASKTVTVTAAIEEEEPAAPPPMPVQAAEPIIAGGLGQYLNAKQDKEQQSKKSDEAKQAERTTLYLLNEVEEVLQFHNVPQALVHKLMVKTREMDLEFTPDEKGVYHALSQVLFDCVSFEAVKLQREAQRIMLVGAPGVGKTLCIAKLAASRVADKLPVRVVTIDNKRAGGLDQLQAMMSVLGIEVEIATTRAELRTLLKEIPANIPVLIDSFGTNPYSFEELKELADFASLSGIEPVLVQAAGEDTQEAADVAQAFSFLNIKRLMVTRIDTARRLGAILSASATGNLSLSHMTFNAQTISGLLPFTAASLAEALMQYRL